MASPVGGVSWGDNLLRAQVGVDHPVSHQRIILLAWNPLATARPPAHQALAGTACPSCGWSTPARLRAAQLLAAIECRRNRPAVVRSGYVSLARMMKLGRRPCLTPRRCSSQWKPRPKWRGRRDGAWAMRDTEQTPRLGQSNPTNRVLDFSMARLIANSQRTDRPLVRCIGVARHISSVQLTLLQGTGCPDSRSHSV